MQRLNSKDEIFRRRKRGQAIIEYLIVVTIVLAMTGVMIPIIKRGVKKLWTEMVRQIAPPCPGCPVDQTIRF